MVNLNHSAPMLSGVCSQLARIFGCNVWALRLIFIVLLLVKTLLAVVAYAILALVFHAAGRYRDPKSNHGGGNQAEPADYSPANQKFADLDRRFREWEESLGQ